MLYITYLGDSWHLKEEDYRNIEPSSADYMHGDY